MHVLVRKKAMRLVGLICALEIAVLALTWSVDPSLGGVTDQSDKGRIAASPAIGLANRQSLDQFKASAERPLFAASRRAAPAGIGKVSSRPAIRAKGTILGRYQLTGIVVTSTVKIAFIRDTQGNRNLALKIGEKLDEWVFDDIKRDRITLAFGARREVFKLRKSPLR